MKRMIAIVLLVLFVFVGCTSKENREPSKETSQSTVEDSLRIVTDATGRNVEIPQHVESIVCVGVGTLRFTTYMQATDLVLGIEEHEHEPALEKPFNYVNKDFFTTLPATGNNGETYDEEIVKLSPDVIMASTFDKVGADAYQKKTGIPVIVIPLIDTVFDEGCYNTLELMGEVYDKKDRAEELITYFKGIEEDLNNRVKDIKEEDKPTVYVGGVSFKGAHGFDGTEANYAPFEAVGAKNLAEETGQKGPFNIDMEKVLQWDPDIIFLDFSGKELINEDYAKNADYYNSLTAVKEDRVYSQIPFRFNAVNAEMALADTYYAGKMIFPEQFKDIDPAKKADEIFEMMLGTKYYDTLRENGYEFREIKIGESNW
ncbi:iron ABC transporter substrate-binding protein [Alkalibaculum bacchi]|uniref:iron ABC transporter substrate-binding protein n=1 Tax=Alkalibaculum bacchi TaxID=645887 RepID=UPI0026F11863|nr:iron ABC transporter substrate-binding protein [Alkalibaculum bacchi]